MKKLIVLGLIAQLSFAVGGIITANIPAEIHERASHAEGLTNIQSLISAVNKARSVQGQVAALKNLNDFTKNPIGATDQVNGIVGNMLNDFNMKSGTSFGNLQDLIAGLASSTTTTGMSLRLQQSSATQLQNISVMLQQMEAENQAMIKYKQADVALKNQQESASKAQDKEISDSL